MDGNGAWTTSSSSSFVPCWSPSFLHALPCWPVLLVIVLSVSGNISFSLPLMFSTPMLSICKESTQSISVLHLCNKIFLSMLLMSELYSMQHKLFCTYKFNKVILLRLFAGGLCWYQHSDNWALLQLHLNSRIHEWNFVWGIPVSSSSTNQRWVQIVKL